MKTAIHWFRRDLRLTDNTALNAAAAGCDRIVPVYILSDWEREHRWTGGPRQEFLCGALRELAASLRRIGGALIIRRGRDQAAVLEQLVQETRAAAIYYNRDPDPYGRESEAGIAKMAKRLGIAVHACKDIGLLERDEVLTGAGTPFKVYGAYARAWHKLEKPTAGATLSRMVSPAGIKSLPLPTLATWGLQSTAQIIEPGEPAARQRLGHFLDHLARDYAVNRNLPAVDGSSRISQDLRWGLLSVREMYHASIELKNATRGAACEGVERFIGELIWRDFYLQVLWFRPDVLEQEFLPQYRGLPWREPGDELERWAQGETGFPLVDAGMRQLRATGFMHNRVRMITAMFLCKDLRVAWWLGEQVFLQHLVDGEIASNNGGWQWCASVGTDAQPYFRIQNPWTQSARHDPDGEYIRRWVPEVRDVATARLSRPPSPGDSVARGYPVPMVDHRREREATLEMFRQVRART